MEILLETFVLFSCLMFWVVFFHKKGTLAKLKKMEASIQSKIHILEDLIDRYQEGASVSSETPPEPLKRPLGVSAQQLKDKLQGVATTAKKIAIKSKEHLLSGDLVGTPSENKVKEKTLATPETVFEQKIESMLKMHSPKGLHPAMENEEDFDKEEIEDLGIDDLKLSKDVDLRQQEKLVVPRTKPIESFQDVINLSKALEKEQTKNGL